MTPAAPQQPNTPGLNPSISVVGDVIVDASPDGSTQESGRRFDMREVELALGANVDPYFRGDFILGISDEEGIVDRRGIPHDDVPPLATSAARRPVPPPIREAEHDPPLRAAHHRVPARDSAAARRSRAARERGSR